MNVIFTDLDGVIDTFHLYEDKDMEKKIKILADICKEYNCKVVIESLHKNTIDEETLQSDVEWINTVLGLFKKYGIDFIGITPDLGYPYSKENEIQVYLYNHPQITHYCVIDDDDMGPKRSDLNGLRDHLLVTVNYSDNYEEEGLLEIHKEQIGNILKLEYKLPEEIKNLAIQSEERRKQEYGRNL